MTRRRPTKAKSAGLKKPPARPKPRPVRPPPGGLTAALDEAEVFRPAHVPDGAVLLVAWTDLPGENTQRANHWAVNKTWKDRLKKDFEACLSTQHHPGIIEHPGVHIAMHVARTGDDNNRLSRAKYVIDLLQEHKVRADGVRVQGLLSLIANDDVLNNDNRTIEEQSVRAVETVKLDKQGRPMREAPYRTMVWVWDQDAHG